MGLHNAPGPVASFKTLHAALAWRVCAGLMLNLPSSERINHTLRLQDASPIHFTTLVTNSIGQYRATSSHQASKPQRRLGTTTDARVAVISAKSRPRGEVGM